ncbi:hypothetical protein FKM82_003930 [Ascaphus truei]
MDTCFCLLLSPPPLPLPFAILPLSFSLLPVSFQILTLPLRPPLTCFLLPSYSFSLPSLIPLRPTGLWVTPPTSFLSPGCCPPPCKPSVFCLIYCPTTLLRRPLHPIPLLECGDSVSFPPSLFTAASPSVAVALE